MGNSIEGPGIVITGITKLKLGLGDGTLKVTFEIPEPKIEDFARLINFTRYKPLNCLISSPQAAMDLKVTEINRRTGEVKE